MLSAERAGADFIVCIQSEKLTKNKRNNFIYIISMRCAFWLNVRSPVGLCFLCFILSGFNLINFFSIDLCRRSSVGSTSQLVKTPRAR